MSTRIPHFLLVLFANSKEIHIFATDGVTSVPIFEGKKRDVMSYLVSGNLENFKDTQDGIVNLHVYVDCYHYIFVSRYSRTSRHRYGTYQFHVFLSTTYKGIIGTGYRLNNNAYDKGRQT